MRQFTAFLNKEILEYIRNKKLFIAVLVFVAFGILNPATAKFTPALLGSLAEELAESGITIDLVKVDAFSSWGQFVKNFSTLLVIFAIMFGDIFTNEYQKGTFINVLTNGMPRWKIVAVKTLILTVLWVVCYYLTYAITYGYTAYYWDNSIVKNLAFVSICFLVVGLWVMSLIILSSTIFKSLSAVLASTGITVVATYVTGLVFEIEKSLPLYLTNVNDLLQGADISKYIPSMEITILFIVINLILAIVLFNKKDI